MTPCLSREVPRPSLIEGLKVVGPPATVVTAVVRMTLSPLVAASKHCCVVTLMLQTLWLNRVTPRQFRRTLSPEHAPLTRMVTSTLCSPCVMALLDVRHLVTGLPLLRVRSSSMPPMHRRASEELFRAVFPPMQAVMNVCTMFRTLMLVRWKK